MWKIAGVFSLIGALVSGSSYQHPRRSKRPCKKSKHGLYSRPGAGSENVQKCKSVFCVIVPVTKCKCIRKLIMLLQTNLNPENRLAAFPMQVQK